MKKRSPLSAIVLFLLLATLSALPAAEPSKPNIVLILIDDMGYGANMESTPNL